MRKTALLLFLLIVCRISAQEVFTRKDSLQGGLRFERTCYDVMRYDLNLKVDIDKKFISGYNEITFKTVENTSKIQVDLFADMSVDSIVFNKQKLTYTRDFNAVFVNFPASLAKNSGNKLRFYYSGSPVIAKNAPWDGGFVFTKDANEKPWVCVAVQGTGASLWYPCKDSQTDEPDLGATIRVSAPNGLMDVSNGRFLGNENLKNGFTRWDWEVKNPINNYDITLNIGDYAHLHDNYKNLDLDYYVLRGHEDQAEKQFAEVKPMMECFESKFGKFPFENDGYKLVETPYLGMEHQTAVAYGNNFLKGYAGKDLSGTGIGMLFDYVVVHESGHEWFGNSITSKDIADMWIHEGFTMYAESVYVECLYGYAKAMQYINGMRRNIQNDRPIIGQYGVNDEGSTDMYYKGALMLNTIRHIVNDDAKWWKILLNYSETYRHKIIDTETVISFFNSETGMDLTPVFNQYLRTVKIPVLEMTVKKGQLIYQWQNSNDGFNMPVNISIDGKINRIVPLTEPQTLTLSKNVTSENITINSDDYLIDVIKNL